jgi:hypothetical protein
MCATNGIPLGCPLPLTVATVNSIQTPKASWQRLIDNVLTNTTFNASVLAASKHYPCNDTSASALQAHKKFWAGEDTPTSDGNWTAASCWGRKLNQHWVKMRATSTVSWAVAWAAYPAASLNFNGNARCAFSDRNLHSRVPTDPAHVRFR